MFDPNEAFEYESEDNEYDPMDDDIAFDSDFLNKVSFNDVVAFLDTISDAIFRFEMREKDREKKDWYVEYYNNPGKEVLINIDPGMFEDIENLVDNYSQKKYKKLLSNYKEKGEELEFLQLCDVAGLTSMLMENINTVGDIVE